MTFYDISKKLLRANFARYWLYFFCNLFAAALFFCFAAIFTNRSFMNGEIVNSSISNNIYLPSLLSALFLVLFLPVSCQVFLGARKQEYGVMLSLGMSRKEAFWNLLIENMAVALMALAAALLAGTILSALFFAFIIYGIGIKGVQWRLDPEPYKITAFLYAWVMAAAFVLNGMKLLRDKIGALLKARHRLENGGAVDRILHSLVPEYMKKHMLEWSFVRRHRREWRFRYGFASCIIACTVMLVSVCVTMCPAFLQDAQTYAPFDLVYSEIYGMNQVPLQDVISILEENDVTVERVVQVPYIRTDNFNCFPVTEVNQSFACEYEIKEGEFLNLFQYDLGDGYEHDIQPVPAVTLVGNEKLYSVGSDIKILFNQNPAFADRTLIVSDSDFEKMKANSQGGIGLANLFLFAQWEDSFEGISAVKEYLNNSNHVDAEQSRYYEVSSKVEKIQDAGKSGRFLIFLMTFVTGLMLTAEFFLIHFRIRGEQEENIRAIYSLYMLGMTKKEIRKCLRYKNTLRFIPPLLFGTLLSLVPSFYLNETYGMGGRGALTGMAFGVALMTGMRMAIRQYSEKELRAVLQIRGINIISKD